MSHRVGQKLGNYRITRLLGQGGFAEVYLGEHVHLGMKAAIKVLHAHLAGEEIRAFHHEAQIIAHLKHPHILRVLDFDVEKGTPFLVLDYAPQGSLRQKHPRGSRLPLPLALTYVLQVADALQFAHDCKLIHRDIKPENMLIADRGEVLLSDFGIATLAHSTSSMGTQASMGTLAYMAPEQIQGKPRPASDQYALGIVIYQWLCGTMPFQGSSTEIIAQHLAVMPPSLRTHVPDLPLGVELVVMRTLAKDPKDRFDTIQDFANALRQAVPEGEVKHQSEQSTPTTQAVSALAPTQPTCANFRAAPSPSQRYARLVVICCVLLAVMIGGIFLFQMVSGGNGDGSPDRPFRLSATERETQQVGITMSPQAVLGKPIGNFGQAFRYRAMDVHIEANHFVLTLSPASSASGTGLDDDNTYACVSPCTRRDPVYFPTPSSHFDYQSSSATVSLDGIPHVGEKWFIYVAIRSDSGLGSGGSVGSYQYRVVFLFGK